MFGLCSYSAWRQTNVESPSDRSDPRIWCAAYPRSPPGRPRHEHARDHPVRLVRRPRVVRQLDGRERRQRRQRPQRRRPRRPRRRPRRPRRRRRRAVHPAPKITPPKKRKKETIKIKKAVSKNVTRREGTPGETPPPLHQHGVVIRVGGASRGPGGSPRLRLRAPARGTPRCGGAGAPGGGERSSETPAAGGGGQDGGKGGVGTVLRVCPHGKKTAGYVSMRRIPMRAVY